MFLTTYKNYFTQDKSQALNAWLSYSEEIEMTGIYDSINDVYDYEFLQNRNDLMAQVEVALKYKNTVTPLVWLINSAKKHFNSITQHLYNVKFMMLLI